MTATRRTRSAPLAASPTETTVPVEPTPPPAGAPDEGDERLDRAAAKLGSRRSLPVDRWFQLAGAALLGIGVLAILGGWYGVSHTARAWRQTPYLVSGGMLGLALVIAGAAAYLAFWLTRLVEQGQRQTAVLERIERALVGTVDTGDDVLVVAPPGILHRSGCPLVAGRTDLQDPSSGGSLRTCPVCEPPLP